MTTASEYGAPNEDAELHDRDDEQVEWQLDAIDVRLVERCLLSAAVAGVELGAPSSTDFEESYLDTEDWRLYRAGYVLRVHSSGTGAEARLEVTGETGGPTHAFVEPLPAPDPAGITESHGSVGERVRLLAAGRALRPLFDLRTARRTYTLQVEGEPAGLLRLDETVVALPDGEPVRLHRVTVTVPEAASARVRGLVEECRLQPATVSTFEAGLLARSLSPTAFPDLGPVDIDGSLCLGEVAFAVLRRHFGVLLRKEAGVRLGEDPEELHDMRVATRRLRAAMRLFSDALPGEASELRDELGWLGRTLGDVRDLDVQLGQFHEWLEETSPEHREELAALGSVLVERREQARERMLSALNSQRYDRLVSAYTSMLQRGPDPSAPAAPRPILAVGPDLIERRFRKVRKAGEGITPASSPDEYHRLRIEGKKLRYALEFLTNVYGGPAKALVRPLVELQDLLGTHQDTHVAMDH
ncbi:MAG: CHAD domain-containing protein, partial [Chloroflexota bacterium]|nr:CHAD domain-containing protein [Chloroflexota bacterium]